MDRRLFTREGPRALPLIVALAMVASLVATLALAGTARAAVFTFTAELTAAAEVPDPGPEGATGSAFITVDDETGEVCYELAIDGLPEGDAVVAAHIHVGEAGVAGDVVVPLFTEPPTGEMTGCVSGVDLELIAAIIANPAGYYVNIHSEDFPNGAVRGQLVAGEPTGGCTLLVWVGAGEPSESVTVQLGDPSLGGEDVALATVNAFGSFVGDADVELTFVQDGTVSFTDTVTADADGTIEFTFGFEAGDEGTWTFEAVVPGTECAAAAEVIVLPFVAAPTATPAAPVLPDTGVANPPSPAAGWAALVAVAVIVMAVGVRVLARERR